MLHLLSKCHSHWAVKVQQHAESDVLSIIMVYNFSGYDAFDGLRWFYTSHGYGEEVFNEKSLILRCNLGEGNWIP